MEKIISFLILFTSISFGQFYVASSNAGAADGSSWANAKSFASLNGAWNSIAAGTTIYIDGGTDSVVYSVNSSTAYSWNPNGTVADPILITKGVDATHNGRAIIRDVGTGTDYGVLAGGDNAVFDNIEFKGGLVDIGQSYLIAFHSSAINITFQYCTFNLNYSEGIGTWGENTSDNIKFLYCNFFNLLDTGTNSASDMMWLGGANHTNWEIAYCNFIMANPKTGSTGGDSHRDIMQCEAGWGKGGTFKIHHNFFDDRSAGMGGAIIESENLRGNWEIYNNIFKSNSTGGAAWGQSYFMGTLSLTGKGDTYANDLKVYNNIIIAMTDMVRCPFFAGWDAVDYRNNIFYAYDADADWGACVTDGWTQQHSMTFTNNQWYSIGSGTSFMVGEDVIGSGARNYTFTQWKAAGYGVGSTWNTDTPDLVDINGLVGTDYALTIGSDGIDDGTTIALVTDDYSGVSRPQGSAYDIGAFEYEVASSTTKKVRVIIIQ